MNLLCFIDTNNDSIIYPIHSKYVYSIKKNKLIVNNNEQYLSNFYDKKNNVELTAVIGKNGVGKTHLLNNFFDLSKGLYIFENSKGERYWYGNKNHLELDNGIFKIEDKKEITSKFILFSNSIEGNVLENRNNRYKLTTDVTTGTKLLKLSLTEMINKDNLAQISFVNSANKKILNYLEKIMKVPKMVVLKMKFNYLINFNKEFHLKHFFKNDMEIIEDFLKTDEKINEIENLFIFNAKITYITRLLGEYSYEEVLEILKMFPVLISEFDEEALGADLTKRFLESLESLRELNFDGAYLSPSREIHLSIKDNNKLFIESLKQETYIIFESIRWERISSGQYNYLNLFARLFKEKRNLEDNSLILLFDEIDLGLHPEWQRQWIEYVPKILGEIFKNVKIQIVFTTHSPLLLSDMRKIDVILLDIDKQEKIKINEGFNSFATNIHELMSKSFFLEGGVIGEFAKNKINATFKMLSKEKQLSKIQEIEIKDILNQIGEPIIKNELSRLFEKKINSRYQLKDKQSEINDLEKRIELLKREIEHEKNNTK